jgi:FkbM family methyltransferase
MRTQSKIKSLRYKNLLKQVSNWPAYLVYKIFGGTSFTFKFKNGRKLHVPKPMMGAFREVFLDQIYYRHLPSEITRDLKTILDVGANAGYFGVFALYRNPVATVHCVEPFPACVTQIQEYAKDFETGQMKVHELGLSGENGSFKLYVDDVQEYSTTSSMTPGENKQAIEIETISFRNFLEQEKLEQVDLVKMDCEGAEYSTIYAMEDVDFNKVSAWAIETHLGSAKEECTAHLACFLESYGYKTLHFDEGNTGYIWAWKA